MKLAHNYFVYIVQCSDGSYYIGVTNDLDRRIIEHNAGIDPKCYTFSRRPVTLKYYEHSPFIQDVIAREKQFKGWGRKKKEALFKGDWELIHTLSRSHSSTCSE